MNYIHTKKIIFDLKYTMAFYGLRNVFEILNVESSPQPPFPPQSELRLRWISDKILDFFWLGRIWIETRIRKFAQYIRSPWKEHT